MGVLQKIESNFRREKKPSIDLPRADQIPDVTAVVEPKKPEPKNPEPKKLEPKKFICSQCGGVDGWLPRAPGIVASDLSNWRCVTCKPSWNPSIVADRCGPVADAIKEREVVESELRAMIAAQTIVVAMETPTCVLCGCSWVTERPTTTGVDRSCWCCQGPISEDAFYGSLAGRKARNEHRKKRTAFDPPIASKNGMDARNGEGKKLCG